MRDYGFVNDCEYRIRGVTKKSYRVWYNMIHRCYNKSAKDYMYYGGAGVYICDEWKSFMKFDEWYSKNNIEGYHVDKDLSGNKYYSKETCKFISPEQNMDMARTKRDYTKTSKSSNPNYKPKEHYETNTTMRASFKRICKNQSWIFEDFEEFESSERCGAHKKYYYKINGGN